MFVFLILIGYYKNLYKRFNIKFLFEKTLQLGTYVNKKIINLIIISDILLYMIHFSIYIKSKKQSKSIMYISFIFKKLTMMKF